MLGLYFLGNYGAPRFRAPETALRCSRELGVSDAMCYNCGCNMPDNPMGMGHAGAERDGKSITNKTLEEAGRSMKQSTDQAKRNALGLLKKVLGEKPAKIVKDPSGFDRYDDA